MLSASSRWVRAVLVLSLTIFSTATLSTLAHASPTSDYQAHRRKSRILLVFSSTETEPEYHRQLEDLQRANADLATRDVVVIPVLLGDSNGDELRARYQVRESAPFEAVLIERDGAEKLRSYRMISAEKIEEIVDHNSRPPVVQIANSGIK